MRLARGTSRRPTERLRRETIPTSCLDDGIIGWDDQDDTAMPRNFPKSKKWFIVTLLSAITMVTPFASSISSPAMPAINKEFGNSNDMVATLSVTIYLLGYAIGPLFLAPLCESYGRKMILGVANAFFSIFQIGCALAPSITMLIVFRFLAGMGGSGCLTLGAGVISDMFETDERGTAMGIFISGPLLGPVIGPLVGGFVVVHLGWRWEFWLVLIVGGALTVLYQIFTVETNPQILIRRKVQYLKKTMGRDDLRSCYDDPQHAQRSPLQDLIRGLVRPMKLLLLSPLVLPLSIYVAFTYGIMYLLFTTIGNIFRETYHFSIEMTGLVYISLGVGTLIGWAIITVWSDRTVVQMTKANGGVFVPEMRLRITLPFAFLMPITFFWYGWSAYYKVQYMSTILSLIPFQAGVVGAVIPMTTYMVDSYPKYAASSVAALTVLRSIGGMMLPLAGPSMYRALGLGWGNSLLGFLSIGLIPVPWLLYKYGGSLRKREMITL